MIKKYSRKQGYKGGVEAWEWKGFKVKYCDRKSISNN